MGAAILARVFALVLCSAALPAWAFAQEAGVDPRPPNAPTQKPAFAGQTRAPEKKSNASLEVVTVAQGLQNPWGLAFLPGGQMLVTERPDRLRVVTADRSAQKLLGILARTAPTKFRVFDGN